jgi:hypothetical protein
MVRSARGLALALETDVRLDGTAGALGFYLYDLPATPWLRFSPYVRISMLTARSAGVATGLETILNLAGRWSVVGKVELLEKDLLAEVTGKHDGVQGIVALGFH